MSWITITVFAVSASFVAAYGAAEWFVRRGGDGGDDRSPTG